MLESGQDLTRGTQLKNSKVKAVYRDAGTTVEASEEDLRVKRLKKVLNKSSRFTKVPDLIAEDDFSVRNEPIPKGKEMFPAEWKMQFVDLFYPYSKPGPLYLDMPVTLLDVAICERKLKVLHEKGIRYTFIKPGEAELEGKMRLEGQDPDAFKADQQALRNKELGL